ncbi:cell wall protein RBR3-like isoform X2 [Alosa sapidissima]|uniref:cell wall protein RBR3-like isoform X2 n=1 Tax=Alosa sapidissima TaxID=34773 RepID=UPI001C09B448|nr:cell wall protein RBR3-like isoform X2 [Alosa sapidissima]
MASASEDPAMYPSEMAAAPQSMPKKTHKQLQHRRSGWSTGLSFTISSPKQPSVRPQTRPSSSGQYTARPASWQYPQESTETPSSLLSPSREASGVTQQPSVRTRTRPSSSGQYTPRPASWQYPQASSSEASAIYPSEMAAAPQSMPKKTHKQLQHRRSDWSTGLSFTISSPKQPSVRPQTRPSSSGQYTARPASWQYPQERTETPSSLLSPSREASGVTQQPSVRTRTRPSSSGQYTPRPASWQYPQERTETPPSLWSPSREASGVTQAEDVEEGAAGASDTSVRDMSISFGEMDLDPKDTRFVPLSDTTSSSPSSGSVSSSGSTDGWAGRKWLVDEAKLMELFRTCAQCGVAIE